MITSARPVRSRVVPVALRGPGVTLAVGALALAGCGGGTTPGDTGLFDAGATEASTMDAPRVDTAGMDVVAPDVVAMDVPRADAADAAPPTGCAAPQPRPTLSVDQAIGVNGLFNDRFDHYAPFGAVREYHNWQWDEGNGDARYPGYPANQNKFDPSYPAPDWHFDAFYSQIHARTPGFVGSPAIQGSAPGWLTPGGNNIPVRTGADRTLPVSFVEHADHLFQFAARYGSTAVADALLKLAPDQARTTGAGTLSYFEDGNEPNSFWISDPAVTFTPAGFAAMASADYDGHCGAMGRTVGVRNADPRARMVMAGLSSDSHNAFDLAFLTGMKAWADAHRHGSFPADVINVHHYCNSGSVGISPEDDHLRTRLEEVVAWRDANAPGRELWLSEFGWDTNAASPQRAPAIGANASLVVQGAWIVRGYMAALAAGVDRAFVFMLTDPNEADATQYASGGLVWHGGGLPAGVRDLDPKPAWYFVATLHTRLAGMRYRAEVTSGNPSVTVYTFRDAATGRGAYVLWCPTASDQHVRAYSLALLGAPTTAQAVTLAAGSANGNAAALAIAGGHVAVDVGEVPTLVMVDAMP